MFTQAVNPTAKQALAILKDIQEIKDFYLAGGTSLALQIGHRISYDLDFFSSNAFLSDILITKIVDKIELENIILKEGTIRGFFKSCEISFFYYSYPLIGTTVDYQDITLASIKDIALMKLIAIGGRGVKKDFYDLYFILKNYISIKELLQCFDEKYGENKINKFHYLKSLTYFEIADQDDSLLNLIENVSWEEVKSYIKNQALEITF